MCVSINNVGIKIGINNDKFVSMVKDSANLKVQTLQSFRAMPYTGVWIKKKDVAIEVQVMDENAVAQAQIINHTSGPTLSFQELVLKMENDLVRWCLNMKRCL